MLSPPAGSTGSLQQQPYQPQKPCQLIQEGYGHSCRLLWLDHLLLALATGDAELPVGFLCLFRAPCRAPWAEGFAGLCEWAPTYSEACMQSRWGSRHDPVLDTRGIGVQQQQRCCHCLVDSSAWGSGWRRVSMAGTLKSLITLQMTFYIVGSGMGPA